ncbi:DUF397 domain-containing protein [Thermopolyspora sp. NPDC052614]|uniref:DUF397 domain-containing protein n=1 Tax=Thermopolyspora sp. NPDC052614 TaxID=3155682 RepID=UPI00343B384E
MDIDLTNVVWRKASRSGASGGDCVEVGVWRKSSHSGANEGNCVEVTIIDKTDPNFVETAELAVGAAHKAEYDRLYVVRDSKDPDGPKLYFTPAEWEAFRLGVLDGEFDDLADEEPEETEAQAQAE